MEFLRFCRTQWDRVGAAVLAVAGLAALLIGWIGLSTKVFPAEQIPYLASGGLLGLFLLGAAGVLWLSGDLQDEWRTLERVDRSLEELVGLWREPELRDSSR
jgi:hypothetical protein